MRGTWERATTLFLFDKEENFVFMLTEQIQVINGCSLNGIRK
jgi:hypothetical protein